MLLITERGTTNKKHLASPRMIRMERSLSWTSLLYRSPPKRENLDSTRNPFEWQQPRLEDSQHEPQLARLSDSYFNRGKMFREHETVRHCLRSQSLALLQMRKQCLNTFDGSVDSPHMPTTRSTFHRWNLDESDEATEIFRDEWRQLFHKWICLINNFIRTTWSVVGVGVFVNKLMSFALSAIRFMRRGEEDTNDCSALDRPPGTWDNSSITA